MSGVMVSLLILLPVLAILLLAIPVSLTIHVERAVALRVSWRIRWLFGLVKVQSERQIQPRDSRPKTTGPSRPLRSTRSRLGGNGKMALAALRTRGFVRRSMRLLTDLRHHVHCDNFSLQMEFGFEDPADTGRVYGALCPMLAATAGAGFEVRCQPNFSRTCLEGSGATAVRIRPISIIGVTVAFFCSPPTLHMMRAVWRARR